MSLSIYQIYCNHQNGDDTVLLIIAETDKEAKMHALKEYNDASADLYTQNDFEILSKRPVNKRGVMADIFFDHESHQNMYGARGMIDFKS